MDIVILILVIVAALTIILIVCHRLGMTVDDVQGWIEDNWHYIAILIIIGLVIVFAIAWLSRPT